MKIKVTRNNEPIFEITKGISAGKPVDMGTFRDRVPEREIGVKFKGLIWKLAE